MTEVQIRILGEEPDLQAVIATIRRNFKVVKQRGPFINRYESGSNCMLNVEVTPPRTRKPTPKPGQEQQS
jgi:hypothetical protein